jgi:hypothetical protein
MNISSGNSNQQIMNWKILPFSQQQWNHLEIHISRRFEADVVQRFMKEILERAQRLSAELNLQNIPIKSKPRYSQKIHRQSSQSPETPSDPATQALLYKAACDLGYIKTLTKKISAVVIHKKLKKLSRQQLANTWEKAGNVKLTRTSSKSLLQVDKGGRPKNAGIDEYRREIKRIYQSNIRELSRGSDSHPSQKTISSDLLLLSDKQTQFSSLNSNQGDRFTGILISLCLAPFRLKPSESEG